MKRFLAMVLVAGVFLFSGAPFVFANYEVTDHTYIRTDQVYATREEAVAIFVRAIGWENEKANTAVLKRFRDAGKIAAAYTREIALAVEKGIVSGYEDDTFRPTGRIKRAEALVILDRILSGRSLPEKVDLTFVDTPIWAEKEIDRLARAGLVRGYGNGFMGSGDPLTREQTEVLAFRATRMLGPTGDFYDYANEKWLEETEIPEGRVVWSDAYAIHQELMQEIGDIIYSLYRTQNKGEVSFPQGSSEQKIVDVFTAGGNVIHRDQLGLTPIKETMEAIDSVEDLKEYIRTMGALEKDGFHGLLPLAVEVNVYDSTRYLPVFSECYLGLNADMVKGKDGTNVLAAYQDYLEDLFSLYGYDCAKERAEKVAALCGELARVSMPLEEHNNIEENYCVYSMEEAGQIFSHCGMMPYLHELGLDNAKELVIYDLPLAKKVNEICTEENLELLKDYLRASVMDGAALYLNTESFLIWRGYQDALNGTESQASPGDYAVQFVEELLGWDLATLYVKEYASAQTKTAVEEMTREILEIYRRRIQKNTWMADKSRQMALKKLEQLEVRVGYPSDLEEYPDKKYRIRSVRDGGNLIEYRRDYCHRYYETSAELLKKSGTKKNRRWSMLPQTVNAMYEPSSNSITIPMGILKEPFYDGDAGKEWNLGAIGSVIAHEISHALDAVGSRFDEKGNLAPWWQPKDEAAFSGICKQVELAYSSIEVLPGIHVNGKATLSENIADLAGMSCILEVAGEGNPRLEDLFLAYASIWRMKATDGYRNRMLMTDTHSPDKVRVNRVLSNHDAFVKYYDLEEGDGMYLPEEERLRIWNR